MQKNKQSAAWQSSFISEGLMGCSSQRRGKKGNKQGEAQTEAECNNETRKTCKDPVTNKISSPEKNKPISVILFCTQQLPNIHSLIYSLRLFPQATDSLTVGQIQSFHVPSLLSLTTCSYANTTRFTFTNARRE